MMVRVLSVLPVSVGGICCLLMLASLVGYAPDPYTEEIPAIPCVGTPAEDCPTGMTNSTLDTPLPFVLLGVEVTIEWSLAEEAWIGVVDESAAEMCPPDENGLTNCTAGEYVFLAGGPDTDGDLTHTLSPGGVRFVTGGHAGAATLQSNELTVSTHIALATWFEALLGIGGVGLILSGVHMAAPKPPSDED